jgi:DNA-directed RNA polymerase sigma subunit (sigma70/sigma32)
MSNQTIAYFVSLIENSPKLKKKEKEILINRLRRKTLKKIGRKHKVCGERIRQVEKFSLEKFVKSIYQPPLFNESEKNKLA